eukprot:SAG31_NODE_1302_length_8900_cov_4.460857_5_plen_163_part_00
MHYDEVEEVCVHSSGSRQSTPTGTDSRGKGFGIRVWLPLRTVDSAPMLLSNTTLLYSDPAARLEILRPQATEFLHLPGGSRHETIGARDHLQRHYSGRQSWELHGSRNNKIFNRDEFVADCSNTVDRRRAVNRTGLCSFSHTLGMQPGVYKHHPGSVQEPLI